MAPNLPSSKRFPTKEISDMRNTFHVITRRKLVSCAFICKMWVICLFYIKSEDMLQEKRNDRTPLEREIFNLTSTWTWKTGHSNPQVSWRGNSLKAVNWLASQSHAHLLILLWFWKDLGGLCHRYRGPLTTLMKD